MGLLNAGLTNDDPQTLAIKETLAKISGFLKEDFQKYLPALMKSIMEDTKADIDIKMESSAIPKNTSGTSVTFKMKGLEGEQRITMNTTALEGKVTAFKLLHQIAENMGKEFAPFSNEVLAIAKGFMNYQYSKAIRKYSLKTIMNILYTKGEPENVQIFRSLLPVMSIMMDTAMRRGDLKELKMLLKHLFLFFKTINETNSSKNDFLDENHKKTLGPLFRNILDVVRKAKEESLEAIQEKRKGYEIDEEDLE